MKFKVISGNLTAHENLHGTHLNNYLSNKKFIAKVLSEELILHDQINIPILDYFTACGLIVILGESNFISLLESNQLKFLKYQGQIVFLKNVNRDFDFGISTPKPPHAWSSPVDVSLDLSLNILEQIFPVKEKSIIKHLILRQTESIDLRAHLDQIKNSVSDIFYCTKVSKKPLNEYLKNQNVGVVNAQILGDAPTDFENPISVLLALMNLRFETNLKEQFECQNMSTTRDFSNLIGLKRNNSEKLWNIIELHNIPDLSSVILAGGNECRSLIKLTQTSKASDFRMWFQSSGDANTKELCREYIGLIDSEPWFKRTVGSFICWGTVVLTGIAYGPLAGVPLSLLNKLLGKVKGRSPKFFINELEKL